MSFLLKVSNSGYYKWLKNPVGILEQRNTRLLCNIKRVYNGSKGRYGSPRITSELVSEGINVSRPRIARLMKKNGIRSIVKRKYRVTTDSSHTYAVSENHLARDFTATEIAQKWVGDITYIRTDEGWLYLTTVLDLADRKIVGWSMSDNMKASATTIAAWKMAIKNRPIIKNLLFHSDRGIQYACKEFRDGFNDLPVLQSMSRKGNCWDNAVAESFFKTLKSEMVYHKRFLTKEQAKLEIFDYIEVWYNRKRRHSAIDYFTPCEYEKMLSKKREAA